MKLNSAIYKLEKDRIKGAILGTRTKVRTCCTINNRPQIKALVRRLSLERAVLYFKCFHIRWYHLIIAVLLTIILAGNTVKALQPAETVSTRTVAFQPIAELKMPALAHVDSVQTVLHGLMAPGTYMNLYAPGNCTYGVASRLPVPNNWGNATNWSSAAAAMGLSVNLIPLLGSIAVSHTDGYLGHVAIVINTSPLTVWEENFNGFGVTDERIANPGEFQDYISF